MAFVGLPLDGILRAVWRGYFADMEDRLQWDPSSCNERGFTAFHFDNSVVTRYTPSMLAIYKGRNRMLERLLEEEPDLEARDSRGWTAGHYACFRGQSRALELLIEHGLSPNARTTPHGVTLLHFAAVNGGGAGACVDVLLRLGGAQLEINPKDSLYDYTPLHRAAIHHKPASVERLVAAGADPTAADRFGRTPLDIAREMGNERCIAAVEAAVAESQRTRALLKARTLLDAAHQIRQVETGNCGNQEQLDDAEEGGAGAGGGAAAGHHHQQQQQQQPQGPLLGKRRRLSTRAGSKKRRAVAASPAYLKGRVAEGRQLPALAVVGGAQQNEVLVACLKYALGLEGGGGVHEGEGAAPQEGMVKEVFVELCEMLVPKWDRP
jgi:26S proteasome non-ATPase regulatory subunit 10